MNASHLVQRIDELKGRLRDNNPDELAQRVGAEVVSSGSLIRLKWWDENLHIKFPELLLTYAETHLPARTDVEAMVLYHLATSDGSPVEGRWISFHDLPDGKFYAQAYGGYTGGEIVRRWKTLEEFRSAALKAGGIEVGGGDRVGDGAFRFQALPKVPLLAVYWEGDDELPPSAQVLFDASVGRHLPADACAVLGSMLVRRVIKSSEVKNIP